MAKKSIRFHGTKADQITAVIPLPDGKVLLASRKGSLEKMEYPGNKTSANTMIPVERLEHVVQFPSAYPVKPDKQVGVANKKRVIVLADDYETGHHWAGKYGKTYALVSGSKNSHDRIIAFDESLSKIRLFVGFVGKRTRPLESTTLIQDMSHHHGSDEPRDHAASLNAWGCVGKAVPKTADGQHLWCEIQLPKPGRFCLSLYFVDPNSMPKRSARSQEKPRDYFVEIFPEPPPARTRIPRGDWEEPGRRADEWAAGSEPLAASRVLDFGDGVYKRFALAGPGTYFVKIDKNYSRRVDLSAVFIDRLDADVPIIDIPYMAPDQTSDFMP
jgi:hypothetical protein